MLAAMVRTVSLALLAVLASCKPDRGADKTQRPARPPAQVPTGFDAGGGPASEAVALFLAPDREGDNGLFQLSPEGGPPTSIAGLDGPVFTAAAAEDGSAVAAILGGVSGRKLVRILPGASARSVPVDLEPGLFQVRAVSRGGEVIVLEGKGSLAAVRGRGERAEVVDIDVAKLGKLMYGVAVSADGARVAFSTMEKSCAGTPAEMASCPVRLYGVDLG